MLLSETNPMAPMSGLPPALKVRIHLHKLLPKLVQQPADNQYKCLQIPIVNT
jgi:hypothetical protein